MLSCQSLALAGIIRNATKVEFPNNDPRAPKVTDEAKGEQQHFFSLPSILLRFYRAPPCNVRIYPNYISLVSLDPSSPTPLSLHYNVFPPRKDLIKACLEVDQRYRPHVHELCQHAYLKGSHK